MGGQFLGGVGEVLQPAFVGEFDHAEFAGLHLVAGEDRHRSGGQPGLGEGVVEQGPQMVDVGALVAPHAHHQGARVQDDGGQVGATDGCGRGVGGAIGDDDSGSRVAGLLTDVLGQRRQRPRVFAHHLHRTSGDDRTRDTGDVTLVGPAELVEGRNAERVGGGGDDGGATQGGRDGAGELVGPTDVTAHQRDGEPSGLVDDDDPRVGLLGLQQRGDETCRGAQGQVGDDEVALPPGGCQPGARGADVLLGLPLEGVVDGLGMGCCGVGVDDLPDDGVTVRAVRVGVGARLRIIGGVDVDVPGELGVDAHGLRGVRVVVEHQDDVGAGNIFVGHHGPGGILVEDAHPLVLLADLLGQHERLTAPGQPVGQLGEAPPRSGEHPNLGMDPGQPDRGLDALGVRGDELGVVPGQGDGGEGGLQRCRGRHHLDVQACLADATHHAEEEGVSRGDDDHPGVVRQRLDALDGRTDEAEFLAFVVGDVEGVEVTLPTDDEVGVGDVVTHGVGDGAEVSVDANHELSFGSGVVLWS